MANNPNDTNKKKKGKGKKQTGGGSKAKTGNAGFRPVVAADGPFTGNLQRLCSDSDACGRLVAALVNVLTNFR